MAVVELVLAIPLAVIVRGFVVRVSPVALPLPLAFALAAVVSPTDPVAVSSIASRTPAPKRLMHILEGESLLNDASGLVCFQFVVAAAVTGTFSLGSAALTIVWVALAGIACGVAFTLAIAFLQQSLTRRFGQEGGSPILVNLLTPFGAYLLADFLHASGILAAVAAGITMSYVELAGRSMAKTRIERAAVWNTLQFALNGIMCVLLGEQLPRIVHGAIVTVQDSGHRNPWWLAVYAVAITIGLAALRVVWVWASLRWFVARRRRTGDPVANTGWRVILAASLAGVRGAITLAGILTLPLLMIALYQRCAHDDEGVETEAEASWLRKADAMENRLRLVALDGERSEILERPRGCRISDEASHKLPRDLDLIESLYRRVRHHPCEARARNAQRWCHHGRCPCREDLHEAVLVQAVVLRADGVRGPAAVPVSTSAARDQDRA